MTAWLSSGAQILTHLPSFPPISCFVFAGHVQVHNEIFVIFTTLVYGLAGSVCAMASKMWIGRISFTVARYM